MEVQPDQRRAHPGLLHDGRADDELDGRQSLRARVGVVIRGDVLPGGAGQSRCGHDGEADMNRCHDPKNRAIRG